MIYRFKGFSSVSAAIAVPVLAAATVWSSAAPAASDTSAGPPAACAGDSGGVTVSPGFCATIFADNLGHTRHLAVAPNGVVYVNTWSGRYYHDDTPPQGGFLVALRDTTGAGHANVVRRFGETAAQG